MIDKTTLAIACDNLAEQPFDEDSSEWHVACLCANIDEFDKQIDRVVPHYRTNSWWGKGCRYLTASQVKYIANFLGLEIGEVSFPAQMDFNTKDYPCYRIN